MLYLYFFFVSVGKLKTGIYLAFITSLNFNIQVLCVNEGLKNETRLCSLPIEETKTKGERNNSNFKGRTRRNNTLVQNNTIEFR